MDRGRARQIAVLLAYLAAGLLVASLVRLSIERLVLADEIGLTP